MIAIEDLRQIVVRLESMGDLIEQIDRDSVSRVIFTLVEQEKPETVEIKIMMSSKASASIGYLESKWRAIVKRTEVYLDSVRSMAAAAFRNASKIAGNKITEAQVVEHLDADPAVIAEKQKLISVTEIADIMQSVRYAVKNMFDGLLEFSRNERVAQRTGN